MYYRNKMACLQKILSIIKKMYVCRDIDGDRGASDLFMGNRPQTRSIGQATGKRFQKQTSFIGRDTSHCSKDFNSSATKGVERSRRSSTEAGDT